MKIGVRVAGSPSPRCLCAPTDWSAPSRWGPPCGNFPQSPSSRNELSAATTTDASNSRGCTLALTRLVVWSVVSAGADRRQTPFCHPPASSIPDATRDCPAPSLPLLRMRSMWARGRRRAARGDGVTTQLFCQVFSQFLKDAAMKPSVAFLVLLFAVSTAICQQSVKNGKWKILFCKLYNFSYRRHTSRSGAQSGSGVGKRFCQRFQTSCRICL